MHKDFIRILCNTYVDRGAFRGLGWFVVRYGGKERVVRVGKSPLLIPVVLASVRYIGC